MQNESTLEKLWKGRPGGEGRGGELDHPIYDPGSNLISPELSRQPAVAMIIKTTFLQIEFSFRKYKQKAGIRKLHRRRKLIENEISKRVIRQPEAKELLDFPKQCVKEMEKEINTKVIRFVKGREKRKWRENLPEGRKWKQIGKKGMNQWKEVGSGLEVEENPQARFEQYLKNRRAARDRRLLRSCGIYSLDKEFEPQSKDFAKLSLSIHANERVQLRQVEKERILGAMKSPHLTRCFHSLSSLFNHQLTYDGMIRKEGAKVLVRVNISDNDTEEKFEEHEISVKSLMHRLKACGDRAIINNAKDGDLFYAFIDKSGDRIHTIIILENRESKMDLKFQDVCHKKILYGSPLNPDRIILVVTSDFSTVVTVIRPGFEE